ncbi:hypothetical protein [Clostridium neonatale]|uniref:Uncharacterized protein n=1 Tax=Clostridium neonatale TaxID=137838 RepID=A0AAD1YK45_9CLOT|nr:hypothetical protein [Clostridium neonatale]MBP8312803.1 hypothetical protein [Clostridium neonatale]CAI3195296.1 hypothetical protein CNEO2_1300017 [Clostridium neonatale]CAI3214050.1 hypothetical protein CNEO2_960008 [Clostridium neonatale]CAI3216189.1 hypothetical protein CNEO2_960017 [Clostridium neonatale]CAI3216721.1 hypothetical protein CNEO2_1030017 [Clostridium neonatale]
MGKLYEEYKKLQLDNNKQSNAQLIYTLVAQLTHYDFHCSIEKGNPYNQCRLSVRVKGINGEESNILLQATQQKSGNVELSIQGLYMVAGVKNFIDYWNSEEYSIFMKYLQCF